MLTGENVLEAAADAYEATAVHDTVDPSTGPTAVTEDVDTDPREAVDRRAGSR